MHALTKQLFLPVLLTLSFAAAQAQADPAVTKPKLESALRDLMSGNPDMSKYEPMLRIAIQQQQQKMNSYFAQAGKVTGISYVGAQNAGDVFQVTFEHSVTAWWIQIAPNGNIAGLFFQ
jgi:hypothetical protein